MGLTGAPAIEAIEAVQPVVSLATFVEERQPQRESGDMIVRAWQGGVTRAASPGNHSAIGVRSATVREIILVKRITITNNTGATQAFAIGRGPSQTAQSWGTAIYTDMRLGSGDLAASLFELHTATPAALPITYGRRLVAIATGLSVVFNVEYIVTYGSSETVWVVTENQNQAITWVSFEGVAYTAEP